MTATARALTPDQAFSDLVSLGEDILSASRTAPIRPGRPLVRPRDRRI